MNFDRVLTILDKEWNEVFKNKVVLLTVALLPLLFTVLPLFTLYTLNTPGLNIKTNTSMPAQFAQGCPATLPAADCMKYFVLNEFLLLFMMMPLIIPTAIAAYSIVGEKTTHSLEPLLATPISTVELLTGKALAAAIPAIAATWISFFTFVALMPLVGTSSALIGLVFAPTWLISVLVLGPLMAIAAVNVAILVSSRVNDPRAAEQISGVMIVPVMILLFGQLAGFIIINPTLMIISGLALALVDIALVWMGASLFQREAILTRWK